MILIQIYAGDIFPMAIKDVFKVSRKTFLNPTRWLGYDELKANTKETWTTIKSNFITEKPTRQETFDEAMQRLNLTEADIQERAQTYLNYAIAFVMLTVCTFVGAFYYLIHHHTLIGCLLALASTSLLATQAFRYHFWYFQIKHRKLGCTFEEWKSGKTFDNEGPTP